MFSDPSTPGSGIWRLLANGNPADWITVVPYYQRPPGSDPMVYYESSGSSPVLDLCDVVPPHIDMNLTLDLNVSDDKSVVDGTVDPEKEIRPGPL